jgi:BirA family biotin operon repressor/biotin-[acetyl-CoA-carboxylase] ligase
MNKSEFEKRISELAIASSTADLSKNIFQCLSWKTHGDVAAKNLLVAYLDSVTSTMDLGGILLDSHFSEELLNVVGLKEIQRHPLISENVKAVVISREQTKGRGRGENIWQSEKDKGLYFNIIVVEERKINSVTSLPLTIGLALRNCLSAIEIECQLKWPNDLVVETQGKIKKIAGILIESRTINGKIGLNIGIGLNLKPAKYSGISSISIEEILESEVELTLLLPALLIEISKTLKCYFDLGFSSQVRQYREASMLTGREILFKTVNGLQNAIVLDVNSDGSLLVEDANKKKHNIYSGEVRLSDDTLY